MTIYAIIITVLFVASLAVLIPLYMGQRDTNKCLRDALDTNKLDYLRLLRESRATDLRLRYVSWCLNKRRCKVKSKLIDNPRTTLDNKWKPFQIGPAAYAKTQKLIETGEMSPAEFEKIFDDEKIIVATEWEELGVEFQLREIEQKLDAYALKMDELRKARSDLAVGK